MKRGYLFMLVLLLIAMLPGCGREAHSPEPGESVIFTGRYVEEQLALPPKIQSVKMLQRSDDGSLHLFASTSSTWSGPWGLWVSQDEGSTWSKQAYDWVEELESAKFLQAATTDGKTFILYYEDEGGNTLIAKAATGSLEPIYQFPGDAFILPPVGLLVGENRNLFLVYPYGIQSMDLETGQPPRDMDVSSQFVGGEVSAAGNMLYLAVRDEIVRIDMATGREIDTVVSSPRNLYNTNEADIYQVEHGHRVVATCQWDTAVYYCDNTGLYRTPEGSPVTELLMGGGQSTLGLPTMAPHQLVLLPEDRYLVLGENGAEGLVLFRYGYDPDMPAEPSKNLRVYSLADAPTVRQAAGVFQREFPAVGVTFQVGTDGGLAADDALRALATELLAGAGPDLLLLDGLPMESYIQKGVLLDLSAELSLNLQGGSYLENIANTYLVDGKLYAVPARFTVPMLAAPESAKNVTDLESLANWLETQDSPRMKYTIAPALLEQFYSVECSALFQGDGTLDEGNYISFLENIARMADYQGVVNGFGEEGRIDYHSDENLVAWAADLITLHVGELSRLYTAALAHQAMLERGDGIYQPLGAGYLPKTIMGVNANGGQQELAVRFLETALSADVLANDFGDGLPVSVEALERNSATPNPDADRVEDYFLFWEEAGEAVLEFYWPDSAFFSGFIQELSTLQNPVRSSKTMQSLITEQSLLCLNGDISPQDGAQELKKKIDLMLAEQD